MTHRAPLFLTTLALTVVVVHGATPRAQIAGQMDEYVRYELSAPATSTFRVIYEVSATTAGATSYANPVNSGSTIVKAEAVDLMTGAPLKVSTSASSVTVTLARPVPKGGPGRIRIETTIKDARAFTAAGVFTEPLLSRRGSVVLPAGFELTGINVASQVMSEADGRIAAGFMHQGPGLATLVVKMRGGVTPAPAAPLTNARSWEPPPAQGSTERSRLSERAHQDRDITYFLQEPSTHAFRLFHDYTESRPGVDKYINVVRGGSTVSDPSAMMLDTGEQLRHETLKGQAIADAKLDGVGQVTPDTEVVVSYFPAVKPGQSVRLRMTETYTAPESYRVQGDELVFERSLGRPRNSVVLPAGWYLTANAVPAVISETPDKLIRLDYFNGRNDGTDVYIKGRKR
jgi:hypothetical protein